ncbi:MAG: hypothetical protein R3322_18965, partial [Kiloniellales bacterium]|nr:hypothetical protein [Kiloniellales bacterium]
MALRLVVWPLQGLALATFWSCCMMISPARAAAFGAGLGRALGPRFRWHRRLRNNLATALPDASGERVAAMAREVWGNFGATVAEYAHLGTIADRAFAEHVEVVVHPGVEIARARGRPLVFVTA